MPINHKNFFIHIGSIHQDRLEQKQISGMDPLHNTRTYYKQRKSYIVRDPLRGHTDGSVL